MGLIAHYKLDGDVLESINGQHGTINGTNFSWENGKINKSIKFTLGSTWVGTNIKTLDESGSALTISFWVYHDFTDWNRSIAYFGERSSINYMFYRNNTWSVNRMGLLTYFINTSDTATSDILYVTVPHQEWVHITIQIKGGNKKIYLNGALNAETDQPNWKKYNIDTTKWGIGSESAVSSSWSITDTFIDDVRVYNHALSIKEIKELSKAQVLHHTFDDFQEPTTNLVTNPTKEVISTVSEFMQWGDIAPIFDTYGTSVKYSLSMDIKTAIGGDLLVYMQNGSNTKYSFVNQNIITTTYYKRYYFNNLTAAISTPTETLAMLAFYGTYGSGRYPSVKNVQIEIKEYCTPFVEGSRTGKVIDNTGNGNDSVLSESTTPKWVNTSKIGSGCYYFNGATTMEIPNFNYPVTFADPFSISIWINVPSSATWTNGYYGNIISRGSYNGSHGIIRSTTDNTILAWMRGPSGIVSRGGTITRNTWNHCLMVNDGTSLQLYINGSLSGTIGHSIGVDAAGDTNIKIASVVGFSGAAGNTYNGYLDDVRYFSTALTADDVLQLYQTRHTLDYNGNLYTPRLNETGYKKLILDYTTWQDGQTGSVGQFSQNGATSENFRVIDTDPWGKQTVVWEARTDAASDADGGWDSSFFAIDNTKTHRISVWIRRTVIGNGNYYLGTNGGGSAVLNLAGGANSNPYFTAAGLSTTEWRLYVGHVHPVGYTGSTHPDSGIYNIINGKIGTATDFKCDVGTTSLRHRSYLYYSTDTNTRQQWVYPRFDVCDGTEPSISELLAGFDSNNIDYIRTIGGTRNLSLDAGSSLSCVGEISEVGVTNGLVAYYPLNGNANDYSGNNYDGTIVGATLSSGIKNECYQFSNGSTYINLPNYVGYSDSVSAFAWFKSTGTPGTGHHIIFGGQELEISINTSDYLRTGVYTSSRYVYNSVSGVGILNGQWHLLGLTFSNGRLCSYIDGVKYVDQSGIGGTLVNSFSNRRIGVFGGDTIYYANGFIDDVRIYNRELTLEEVGILFEMGLTDKKMKLTKDTIYIKGELKEGY